MYHSSNRGFTMVELVTVISILGILAAMAVPKFFNLRFKAQIETERQILGTIRAGLETFAAHKIAFTGIKTYPVSTTSTVLLDILSRVPSEWSYTSGTPGTITHSRSDSTISWTYTRSSNDVYSIGTRTAL